MNILFYTPFTGRSRDTETLMIKFKELGHQVFFISQNENPAIQPPLIEKGIIVNKSIIGNRFSILLFARELLFLIKFCWSNKIDVVFSHLEPAHIVAVVLQFFIRAKVHICRHHIDEMHLAKKDKLWSYRLTYTLGKSFIVVSNHSKEFMVNVEHIDPEKITVINLSYDFALYGSVIKENVNAIKSQYPADLLLITACRLVKDKRPDLSIEVLEGLVREGVQAKLLILGEGEMSEELKSKIVEKGLSPSCFVIGKKNNILDYLSAADVLLHPSIIDSSSVIVKEAGLVSKVIIACKGVGDFDEYIINDENGFLVHTDDFAKESIRILLDRNWDSRKDLIGTKLKECILERFSIEHNISKYELLLSGKSN